MQSQAPQTVVPPADRQAAPSRVDEGMCSDVRRQGIPTAMVPVLLS